MTRGQRIRKLRTDAGYSQTDLATRIGVSKQTLYKYENDIITNIPSDMVVEIAKACNSTPEFIMGWEGSNTALSYPDTVHTVKDTTTTQLYTQAEDKAVIDMYLDLDAGRKAQAGSYIGYLHTEWEKECSTEKQTAGVVTYIREETPEYLLPNAAHENNPTEEQRKHADDIMANDDEW